MSWAVIIATILPIILECFNKGTGEEIIRARLRNPKEREIRKIRRNVRRRIRQEEPELRRRERRVKVDTQVDDLVIRAREATDAELDKIIAEARS